jgi:hypothetical protein
MAHDVFISHSTEDKPVADAVCATLEKNGVRCWFAPRDILPGADWSGSIVNAIQKSRVLLLVFSTRQTDPTKSNVKLSARQVPVRMPSTAWCVASKPAVIRADRHSFYLRLGSPPKTRPPA